MAGVAKEAVVPVEAVLLGLAAILVFARLFLRLVRQRQLLNACDWVLAASLLNAVALFVTDTMAYTLGGMDEYDPHTPPPPADEQTRLMKVSFAGNYFYDTGIYLPKLALLAFYFRLIPPTMPPLRKALYAVSGLTLGFAVTTCFLDTFWCGPDVSVNWDVDGSCSAFDSKEVFRIDWGMNIVSDLMIFALPFPLLHRLQLKRRYIIGLVATFSMGMITIAASVSRFATVEVIHAWTNVYVLSMTEMSTAIIVVSLPALKPLLRRRGLGTSGYGTVKSASGGDTYGKHPSGNSHFKLSSGRDHHHHHHHHPYPATSTQVAAAAAAATATATAVAAGTRDMESSLSLGSEVELNNMKRSDVIYKSACVTVTYQPREDAGGNRDTDMDRARARARA